MSPLPPAEYATTILTGRSGQAAASDRSLAAINAPTTRSDVKNARNPLLPTLTHVPRGRFSRVRFPTVRIPRVRTRKCHQREPTTWVVQLRRDVPSQGSLAGSRSIDLFALPTRHEEIQRQFGADSFFAGNLDHAQARGCELNAHAHVVVVIGDLSGGCAPCDAADTEVADLVDVIPGDVALAHRHHDFRLVVEFDLLLEVGNDKVGAPGALVVEFSATVELVGADHADDMAAGREPVSEQDRIG